jgi:hypothetical protein
MDRRVHVQLGLLRPTVIDIEAKKPNTLDAEERREVLLR